jgi:Cu/Ag efflux pump CusA
MRAIVATLLRHRPIALALLAAFVVAGVIAFRDLPIEAYPDVTNIQAQVITLWPGYAAEEVERFITIPVENELNSIPQRLPAAMSRGVGAETARPFAVVIIGGLVTATLLTLVVLPVLYSLFESPVGVAT